MPIPEEVFRQLSTPDLEAYVEGRQGDMTTEGRERIQGATRAPAIPAPGLMGATPSRALAEPSGGRVTPGEIGTFAAEYGPPMVGQTLGAMAGGALPFPLNLAGVPILGGAGAVGGKYVSNKILGRAAPTPAESATEFTTGAATEVGGQLLTRGVPLATRGLLGAQPASRNPGTAEAVKLSERYGIPLSGGQLTRSAGLAASEQVGSRVPFGVQRAMVFGEAERTGAAQAVQRLQRAVGGAPGSTAAETGVVTGQGLTRAATASKAEYDRLYKAASDSAGGTTIPGPNRLEATAKYLQSEGMVAPGLRNRAGVTAATAAQQGRAMSAAEQAAREPLARQAAELRALKAEIQDKPEMFREALMKQFPNLDNELGVILTRLNDPLPMTYAQTRDLAIRLGKKIDQLEGKDKHQFAQLLEIKKAIKADIRDAANATGGDFATKLDEANRYASEVHFANFNKGEFPAKLIAAAAEHPEEVVPRILASDSVGIRQIKKILGPEWKGIQSHVLDDLASRSQATVDEVGGQVGQRFSVEKWLALTESPTSPYRMDRLKEILPPESIANIQDLNKLFRVMQRGGSTFYGANPSGTAGSLLAFSQLGAIATGAGWGTYGLLRGDLEQAKTGFGGAALSIAGPTLLTKMLLSKGGRDIIAKGMTQAKWADAWAAKLVGPAARGGARALTTPIADAVTPTQIPPMPEATLPLR